MNLTNILSESVLNTPVEINIGKSYVSVTDVDYAENFVHSKLDGVDLSSATTVTYESHYVEDDAEEGETLGMSTDDLTTNATGSGEAETVTEEPAAETPAEDSAEVPADSTGEPVADDPEAVG